jgi:TonB family protein
MTTYLVLHFGLILALALVAVALGRSGRRSELAHLAWVLVFVKLLVPPFVEVPVLAPEVLPAEPQTELVPMGAPVLVSPEAYDLAALELAPARQPAVSIEAGTVLLWAWIAGAALCAALIVRSILRYRRLLGESRPPSATLAAQARAAASALGLGKAPRLRVTDARISPALWPSRPATLVLPAGLVEHLSPDELRHVLLHEMAHLARKDHWVRLLEAFAQVVYWWLPPVAWMRARLRASEEACCDARVLRSGGDGSVYAQALIRTVEFLQGRSTRLPALATGAFGGSSLTQRITMIMSERPHRPRGMVWRVLFAGSLLALLPLLPARASAVETRAADAPPARYEPPPVPVPPDEAQGDEPTVSEAERELLNEVLERIAAGDRDAARERLEKARGPNASAALDFTAGNLDFEQERLEDAEQAYGLAVAKHPTFLRAWRNLAMVRMRSGAVLEASEAFRRTIALGGGDAVTYGLLGSCLLQVDDAEGAEPAFWMATVLDPATADWRLGLLNSLFQQGRHADAVTLITDMLEQHPDDAQLQLLRANAWIALGQPERAAEDLARVEELGAATSDSRLLRADIELNAGRYADAVEGYRRALAADSEGCRDRALRAARVLAAQGQTEHASTLLALLEGAAPALEPRILIAVTARGQVVYGGREIGVHGVRPLVARLTERAELPVVVQVDEGAAAGLLVRVLDEARLAGASRVRIASASDRSTGDRQRELLHLRARIEAARGEAGDEQALTELLELDPLDGEALLLLGRKRQGEGAAEAALALFDQAARLEGYEADARLRKGQALASLGRYGEAAVEVRRAQEIEPRESATAYLEQLERLQQAQSPRTPPPVPPLEAGYSEASYAIESSYEAPFDGSRIVEPRPIHRVAPKLTSELREHLPAIVRLAFLVDEEGEVGGQQVIQSTDPRFERAALEAIEQWRFEPGTRDGQPLVMETRMILTFPVEGPVAPPHPPSLDGEREPLDLEELERQLGADPSHQPIPTASDDRPAGSIRGAVRDGDFDGPLSACQVTVVETGTQVSTSDQGLYVLEGVPPGKYTLTFVKEGYARQVRTDVVVSPGGLTQVTVALSGEYPDMEEFVVEPEDDPVVIAITADGRVINAGREVGVAGVRPLVERLLADGNRPVFLKVDGRADPQLWSRVAEEAELGGATSVDVQLLLAVALADLDSKPRPLYQPAPKLTPELRKRAPATVTVTFLLDEGGRVSDPVVESTSDEAFNHAALEAIKSWRFEPGLRDGHPVCVRMRVPITFPEED